MKNRERDQLQHTISSRTNSAEDEGDPSIYDASLDNSTHGEGLSFSNNVADNMEDQEATEDGDGDGDNSVDFIQSLMKDVADNMEDQEATEDGDGDGDNSVDFIQSLMKDVADNMKDQEATEDGDGDGDNSVDFIQSLMKVGPDMETQFIDTSKGYFEIQRPPVNRKLSFPTNNVDTETNKSLESLKLKQLQNEIQKREMLFNLNVEYAKKNYQILKLEYEHKKKYYAMIEEEQELKIMSLKKANL